MANVCQIIVQTGDRFGTSYKITVNGGIGKWLCAFIQGPSVPNFRIKQGSEVGKARFLLV